MASSPGSRESGGPGCSKSRQRRAEFRRYCLVSLRLLRQTPAVSCLGHSDVTSRNKCIDSVRPARGDRLSRCAPATGAPALRASPGAARTPRDTAGQVHWSRQDASSGGTPALSLVLLLPAHATGVPSRAP